MNLSEYLRTEDLCSESYFCTVHVPDENHHLATIYSSHPTPEPLGERKFLGHGSVREAYVDGMPHITFAASHPHYASPHYEGICAEMAIPLGVNPVAVGARIPTALLVVRFATADEDRMRGAHHQKLSSIADQIGKWLLFREPFALSDTFLLPESLLLPEEFARAAANVQGVPDWMLQQLSRNPFDVHGLTDRKFEELVAELLRRDGYDVLLTPQTRDGGFDLVVEAELPVGRILTLVECKKWRKDRPVGVSVIRNLYGVVNEKLASNGLLVTSSRFTQPSVNLQNSLQYRVDLRDFDVLARWIKNNRDSGQQPDPTAREPGAQADG